MNIPDWKIITKEELDWLVDNWTPGNPAFRMWISGSNRAHDIIGRLIANETVITAPDQGFSKDEKYEDI